MASDPDYICVSCRLLKQIGEVQNMYSGYDIACKLEPLLARSNQDINTEVLCVFDVLLFNANSVVQVGHTA